jgi:hypothetical protein
MRMRTSARWMIAGAAAFALGWTMWAVVSWTRYDHGSSAARHGAAVQHFMPDHEVDELFETRIRAPASVTFSEAESMSLDASPVIRAIFRAREILLGGATGSSLPRGGVVDQMRAMGWGVLSEVPQREIVLGAVTQPWNSNVVFRSLPAESFASFHEPGFVKILVTINAAPTDSSTSRLRIGTYATTTDPLSRSRFRRYWAVFSPGILLIRAVILNSVKDEAERRHRSPSQVIR